MSRSGAAAIPADPPGGGLIEGTTIPLAPSSLNLLAREAREARAPGQRKGERTRRLVRLAAARALADLPFAAVAMDHIAAEAGVSRAALYQYYRSKEDLIREVLTDFHDLTINFPAEATHGQSPDQAVYRTNRYFVDYVARNAVFMERVRELRHAVPELLAKRQRINAVWAERIAGHVRRNTSRSLDGAALTLRIVCLECMIDDVLREAFVVRNPALAVDPEALAAELSAIWIAALYGAAGREVPPGAPGGAREEHRTRVRRAARAEG